jgi:NDP-sugar pyrophosphorylase family protein
MENTEQKKYILLEEDQIVAPTGNTLYRIKAVQDFSNVLRGVLGGYIQHEDNLSHAGDCWVYDNARVYDDAQVLGNAKVCNNAKVRNVAVVDENAKVCNSALIAGYAIITGHAHVSGCAVVSEAANVRDFSSVKEAARVKGKAKIEDNATISGHAVVQGNASVRIEAMVSSGAVLENRACIRSTSDVCVIGPIGSEDGTLTAYLDRDREVRCTRGCFSGTLEEFSKAVEQTHKQRNPSILAEYQRAIEFIETRFSDLRRQ